MRFDGSEQANGGMLAWELPQTIKTGPASPSVPGYSTFCSWDRSVDGPLLTVGLAHRPLAGCDASCRV